MAGLPRLRHFPPYGRSMAGTAATTASPPRPRGALHLADGPGARTAAVRVPLPGRRAGPDRPGPRRGRRRNGPHGVSRGGRRLRPRARTGSARSGQPAAPHRARAARPRLHRPLRRTAGRADLPLSHSGVDTRGRTARAPSLPARPSVRALPAGRRRSAGRSVGDRPGGGPAAPKRGVARLALPRHRLLLGRRRRANGVGPVRLASVRDRGGGRLSGRCPRDRARAEAAADRLGRLVRARRLAVLDPERREEYPVPPGYAPGEQRFPHDYARVPESPARHWFTDDEMARSLDFLAAQQREDGGWPVSWRRWAPGTALEWRPIVTIEALRTLCAHGRTLDARCH